MRKLFIVIILNILISMPLLSYADNFERGAGYTVCFTPGQNCTGDIVDVINSAISNIWVQAYSFTAKPIAKALVLAKQRGVNVQIILDKEALMGRKDIIRYFVQNNIPVWIDNQPAIAHNKVMIIDQTQVITGSFNFTYAAQKNNAENLLIIYDEGLASKYLSNWKSRQRNSEVYKAPAYTSDTEAEKNNWWSKLWKWLTEMFNKLFFSNTR